MSEEAFFNDDVEDLLKEVRRRLATAHWRPENMSLKGLPFSQVDAQCNLEPHPDDVPSTRVMSYEFPDTSNPAGDQYFYQIHRLGKWQGKLFEIVVLGNVGGNFGQHEHRETNGQFLMLRGRGFALMGREALRYGPGSKLLAPAGMPHGFIPTEPSIFIGVFNRPIVCAPDASGKATADYFTVRPRLLPSHVRPAFERNKRFGISKRAKPRRPSDLVRSISDRTARQQARIGLGR